MDTGRIFENMTILGSFSLVTNYFCTNWNFYNDYLKPRATFNWRNVWLDLHGNWINFFWLTGETPGTLNALVNELEHRFMHYFVKGRECKLDLRNQVSFVLRNITMWKKFTHLKLSSSFNFCRFYLQPFGYADIQLWSIYQCILGSL